MEITLRQDRWQDRAYDNSSSHPKFLLGIDAEVIPVMKGVPIYPHQAGLLQERQKDGLWTMPTCGDWHGDGYAFEVCSHPSPCLDAFMGATAHLFRLLYQNLEQVSYKEKSQLKITAPTLYELSKEIVTNSPPEIRRLGCAPSFNVYGDRGDPESLGPFTRTTGAHLHISHPKFNEETCKRLVRWADVIVGCAWAFISPEDPKIEKARRVAYGRAGEHRLNIYPEPHEVYGVEYRVIPGRAITHPAYITLMLNLYREAARWAMEGKEPSEAQTETARTAINESDRVAAEKVLADLAMTNVARETLYFYNKTVMPILSPAGWEHFGANYYGWYITRWYLQKGYPFAAPENGV